MDKRVTDFNVRLRTIRIRDLIVGIIITAIITGILTVIFPEISESDELFFIVLFLIGALMFVWALRGTRGLAKRTALCFCNKSIVCIPIYLFDFLNRHHDKPK